jgi:hypothetical protein
MYINKIMQLYDNAFAFLSMLNQYLKVSTVLAPVQGYSIFPQPTPGEPETYQILDAYKKSKIRRAGTRAFSFCHGACYKTQTDARLEDLYPRNLVPRRTCHQIVFESPKDVGTSI